MNNVNINFKQLTTQAVQFLHRYHVVIFTFFAIGGLAIATFMLNIAISGSSSSEPPTAAQRFDAETMEKIKELNKAGEDNSEFSLPSGRTNPFITP